MKDYRWRLTNKVKRILRNNHPVVIIAGPQMGKSHLVKLIRDSEIPVRILEEVEPYRIPKLIDKPSATLITTDISFLEPSIAFKEQCFRVPLTTIMHKHINRWDETEWNVTGGHPALASSCNPLLRKQTLRELETNWCALLSNNPEAYELLLNLREHQSSPVEHYQRLRRAYGKATKPTLDWLVCLGTIHRQKYKGGAGISPVPMNLNQSFTHPRLQASRRDKLTSLDYTLPI